MPTKNVFLSSSLTPTHSSHYPFLYSACKRPLSLHATSTSLNCQQSQNPLSGTTLNCNLTQTSHDMPSSHVRHLSHLRLLEHWMYCGMPSGPYIILGHPSHLSHLGHLSNIGDLDPLDPSPLDPTPTDSLQRAFITEMDPMDPSLSEGCYADDSLDPLHTEPTLETNTQVRLPWSNTDTQVRQMPLMGTAPS
jgi:hypothetical protein